MVKQQKIQKWLDLVKQRGSQLVAGLDPADPVLNRGEKGLPQNKEDNFETSFVLWMDNYLGSIADCAAGLKFNTKFFQDSLKLGVLESSREFMESCFFTIADCKLADLDSSNEAEMHEWAEFGVDAITVAPYAGNLQGMADTAARYGLGVISVCLMSAPSYASTKNSLVPIDGDPVFDLIDGEDMIFVAGVRHVNKYIYDAANINITGALGAMIDAPSEKNGLTMEEINKALYYLRKNDNKALVLISVWGEQGGGIEFVKKIGNYAMINQSRGLMFPHGSHSTPSQQHMKAEEFKKQINKALSA